MMMREEAAAVLRHPGSLPIIRNLRLPLPLYASTITKAITITDMVMDTVMIAAAAPLVAAVVL